MTHLLAMDAAQIILIVFIALLIIAYPVLISTRNKKEKQKLTEQTNSLKRGDKVLTTSGVYGTIVDLHLDNDKQIVTIETGTDKKKGYLSIDAYAIYTVFKEGVEEPKKEDNSKTENKKDDKPQEKAEVKTETKKDDKKEVNKDIKKEEKPIEVKKEIAQEVKEVKNDKIKK